MEDTKRRERIRAVALHYSVSHATDQTCAFKGAGFLMIQVAPYISEAMPAKHRVREARIPVVLAIPGMILGLVESSKTQLLGLGLPVRHVFIAVVSPSSTADVRVLSRHGARQRETDTGMPAESRGNNNE